MQIELTSEEITIIDRALVAWQVAPSKDGMMGAMLGCMFEKDEAKRKKLMEDEKSSIAEMSRLRELQTMRIRLKLNEYHGRAIEFEAAQATTE